VLGCAVSRLLVELLGDTGFDDLFDVRKAGMMSTTAAIASIEYAVAYLAAPAIVVLGHQRCGAVEAAFHAELGLTPSRPRVVGQLRMELFVLAAAEDRSRPAASMPSTRREIWWIPAFRRLHHAAAARP
jgi:carbonic anhydrase